MEMKAGILGSMAKWLMKLETRIRGPAEIIVIYPDETKAQAEKRHFENRPGRRRAKRIFIEIVYVKASEEDKKKIPLKEKQGYPGRGNHKWQS